MPSKTMRLAPSCRTLTASAASMALMSNVPLLRTSGRRRASRKNSLRRSRSGRFQPKADALAMICSGGSSKATKIPLSPWARAPLTSVCSARMVLPQPAPPKSIVVRPRGRPPRVAASSPGMPVGALFKGRAAARPLELSCSARAVGGMGGLKSVNAIHHACAWPVQRIENAARTQDVA